MEAKELRIGNWVYGAVNGEYKVDCNILQILDGFSDYVKPIPLTEEWLLKFGFVSNPYQDRYELGDIDVECDKTKGKTELWISGLPHIKYVHQLQNLYFALTGKEL